MAKSLVQPSVAQREGTDGKRHVVRRTGIRGRLPTEPEWEYAARAGTTASRHGDVGSIAWYSGNSGKLRFDGEAIMKRNPNDYGDLLFKSGAHPHPVAQKVPNPWDLYDTLGNVWEGTGTSY